MIDPRVTITRHDSALGRWEYATARPAEALRPFVRQYIGWHEDVAAPLLRRELPTDEAPLIINFGAAFRLCAPGTARHECELASFVTGAYDTYQIVESYGSSGGVQANFTLLGMRLLVGRPIEDLTNVAVTPEDVVGAFARELAGRLFEATSWEARFTLLERALAARIFESPAVPDGVRHAWDRLVSSGGRVRIGDLAGETRWSRRHFIAQFRHELGISPKVFARVLRFGRFVRMLKKGRPGDLAELAATAGYYDQSHLARDVREFAGATPGGLRRSLIPDGGGFAA